MIETLWINILSNQLYSLVSFVALSILEEQRFPLTFWFDVQDEMTTRFGTEEYVAIEGGGLDQTYRKVDRCWRSQNGRWLKRGDGKGGR